MYTEHNKIWLKKENAVPAVGMGVTLIGCAHLMPYTVSKILSDKMIVIEGDYIQDGVPVPNLRGVGEVVLLFSRKTGRWTDVEGDIYLIGERTYYIEQKLEK